MHENKRQNLVTRERFLKGDLDVGRDAAGYINQAQVADRSILAYLCKVSALDDGHLASAATYALWQYAFQKPFFAEPRKMYLIEIAGDQGAGGYAEAAYRKLLRRLSPFDQKRIEFTIVQDAHPKAYPAIYHSRGKYQSCFDLLTRTISDIRKELEEIADHAQNKPCASNSPVA